ncbi:MAG TPA: ABC transporter permease [Bryobacteraceae bacterium]|nr:ABC transporter permease [Bryobacteraceae bacterium]
MLKAIFPSQLALGAAQAALCATVALLVAWIARRREIRVERETAVALARGLAQIVAVGSVLVLLLRGPQWTSVFVLAGMTVAAAATSARRARGIPGAFAVSLYSIGAGAGLLIVVMTLAGVIDAGIASLVPMGSMLIANAMNTNSLALNRFRAEVEAHAGLIETGVALGAAAPETVLPYARAAYHASLIPPIDSLRSLGIVWIPGLMTGMLLSGARPLYAAIYQFVTISMMFSCAGLTSLVSTLLIRNRVFTAAEQLILRPGLKA